MNEKEFLDWCKEEIVEYTNSHLDKSDNKKIYVEDVFVVWCCKTLQNNKALLSTTLLTECTMSVHTMVTRKSYTLTHTRNGKIDV